MWELHEGKRMEAKDLKRICQKSDALSKHCEMATQVMQFRKQVLDLCSKNV